MRFAPLYLAGHMKKFCVSRILLACLLTICIIFPARVFAAGGSYSLNYQAANPQNYDRKNPSQVGCPVPGGGSAADPIVGANFGSSLNSLAPASMALGQIVPYELKVSVSGSTSPENGIINTTLKWDTETTSGRAFGYDPAYQVYCAFVDSADAANANLDGNENVSYTSQIDATGRIQGNFNISGLNDGDTVIVEIWVVLKNTIPSDANGNVQSNVESAQTGAGDNISVGNQTIPLLKVQEFFSSSADVQVQKIDAPDPAELLSNITYTVEVSNLSSNTVANNVIATDTLDSDTVFVSVSVLDTEGAASSCDHDGSLSGGVVTCDLDFLNPMETVKITIVATVKIDAALGTGGTGSCVGSEPICNNVSVAALNDNNLENNSASQPTGVVAAGPYGALHVDKVPDVNALRSSGQVTYSYAVTNSGVGNISNVTLSDDKCTPVTYLNGDVNQDELLQPNETWNYSCTTTLTQTTTNTVTANGTDVISEIPLESVDTATVIVIHPAIQLVKSASASEVVAGSSVTYAFVVTNIGDDALTQVSVTDPNCSPITFESELLGDGDSILEPTEQWRYICSRTINQTTLNTAVANATDSLGGDVASDSSSVTVVVSTPTPQITPLAVPTIAATAAPCNQTSIKSLQFALDGVAHDQVHQIKQAATRLSRLAKNDKKTQQAIVAALKIGDSLLGENWTLAWSLPSVVIECTDASANACIRTTNQPTVSSYNKNAETLRTTALNLVKRLTKLQGKQTSSTRRLIAAIKRSYMRAVDVSGQVPPEHDVCPTFS